jgi:predicted nucleotidyltransferase
VQLTDVEREALAEFSRRIRARFGRRVDTIALFGSRARGEAHDESDIDVCVVIDGLVWNEWREINHIAVEIAEERDVWELSPFSLSTERMNLLRSRERLIAAEIDKDGIRL